MSQAESSSAAAKSRENVAGYGWRESILVLVILLAPMALAAAA